MDALGYRVVVADTDRIRRTHLCEQLKDAGYEVDAFTLGEDAILHGEINTCHALILDMNLSDIDAFEVCTYVRRCWRNADAMIVMMTDTTDRLTRDYIEQMADYAGADFFCTKPCDHRVLVALLDEIDADRAAMDDASRPTTSMPLT